MTINQFAAILAKSECLVEHVDSVVVDLEHIVIKLFLSVNYKYSY
jgi:hypothetical protein